MVLPLRTTSRLSVSIVILVVFTTTACSGPPIATAAASIERILRESAAKSLQCAVQYFSMSFKRRFEATDARSYERIEGQLPEKIQGVLETVVDCAYT